MGICSLRTLAGSVLVMSASMCLADGAVKGTVYNKETGEVIDYATVQLIDATTEKPLAIGTNTDESGNFVLEKVPDGKYLVKISNIGSVSIERPITILGNTVNIGSVRLADDSKMLQEVVVEGVRSQMKFELDKKVFTVDANIVAAGSSASELLESIPSVEVDQDGEVSLRGNSSVTVWINGKESGLTADNRAQILEQIPGETIERIEVITNPSAKYSPEGTAGIINIVLKKDRRGGYFGSAEIGANTKGGGNASFSFNYNNNKWDAYASVGFRMRNNTRTNDAERNYDDGTFLNKIGRSKNHGNNLFVRAGATYHLTANDEFSVNAFGMFGHRWGKSHTDYSSDVPGSWISSIEDNHNKNDMRGAHGEIGYLHRWSDNHYIDIVGSYNYWGGPGLNTYEENSDYADGSSVFDYREQHQNINVNNWEVKADYTNQILSWLKLEAGFNGNYSYENSPVSTYRGQSASELQIVPDLYNRFIYDNNISALYVTLGGKYRNFSFSAGLRGEAWQVRAKSLGYGVDENSVEPFKKNSFALFPSAFISYSLPHDNELQINYTRRIRRPWGGQLNPFHDISDPTNIRYGNQELQPQYSNAFELNYIKSWTYHIISFSGYLRTTEDVINRISYIADGQMYTTEANATSQLNLGCEIVSKNSFFNSKFDLTTTVNLYNSHLDAWTLNFMHEGQAIPVSGVKQNSFAWDLSCMANVRLPWDISFQATGRYNSRQIQAQGTREPGWSVDAGLRKSVGDWSFSVNCRDVFNSRKWHSITNGDGYRLESWHAHGGTRVQFTVKYSFGNMKAKKGSRAQEMEPMDGSGYGESMQ